MSYGADGVREPCLGGSVSVSCAGQSAPGPGTDVARHASPAGRNCLLRRAGCLRTRRYRAAHPGRSFHGPLRVLVFRRLPQPPGLQLGTGRRPGHRCESGRRGQPGTGVGHHGGDAVPVRRHLGVGHVGVDPPESKSSMPQAGRCARGRELHRYVTEYGCGCPKPMRPGDIRESRPQRGRAAGRGSGLGR